MLTEKYHFFPPGDIRPGVCLSVQRNNTDITLTLQSKNGGRSSDSDQQKSFCASETCDSITLIIGKKSVKVRQSWIVPRLSEETRFPQKTVTEESVQGANVKLSQWGCLLSTVAQRALLPEQKNMSDRRSANWKKCIEAFLQFGGNNDFAVAMIQRWFGTTVATVYPKDHLE